MWRNLLKEEGLTSANFRVNKSVQIIDKIESDVEHYRKASAKSKCRSDFLIKIDYLILSMLGVASTILAALSIADIMIDNKTVVIVTEVITIASTTIIAMSRYFVSRLSKNASIADRIKTIGRSSIIVLNKLLSKSLNDDEKIEDMEFTDILEVEKEYNLAKAKIFNKNEETLDSKFSFLNINEK